MLCRDRLMAGAQYTDLFKSEDTFECAVKYSNGLKQAAAILGPEEEGERELKTEVFWGPSGTGKTQAAFLRDPDLYQLAVPNSDQGSLWFDHYAGQKTLLIDEFQGWIGFPFLKKLCDPWYPQKTLPQKHSSAPSRLTSILICSNYHPFRWYNRLTIGHLKELTRRIHRAWRCTETTFEMVDLEAQRLECERAFGADKELPYQYTCD